MYLYYTGKLMLTLIYLLSFPARACRPKLENLAKNS